VTNCEKHVRSIDGRHSRVKVVYLFKKNVLGKEKKFSGRLNRQTILCIYFSSIFLQTCTTVNIPEQEFYL